MPGRTPAVDAGAFNVMRADGTNTRRASLTVNWSRPFVGALGDLWKVTLHADATGYDASSFNQQPNFGPQEPGQRGTRAAAGGARFPLAVHARFRRLGHPADRADRADRRRRRRPATARLNKYPNEDSLDLEFTDANLFGFNRFPGIDRLEGGVRANVALHGAWYLGGTTFDGLIGQSYRTTKNNCSPRLGPARPGVGRRRPRHLRADRLARPDLSHAARPQERSPPGWPTRWHRRRAEILGHRRLHLHHLNPYTFFDQPPPPPAGNAFFMPRNEITLGASSNWGKYRFSGWARRNLQTNQMVAVGADAIYEDECYILISGSIVAIPRTTATTARQRACPDDLQDDRTVRLQGALTIRRPRSWPTQHPHGCALRAVLLRLPRSPAFAAIGRHAGRRCGAGDADRRGGERRRDQQGRRRQSRPAVRPLHRPADDAGRAGPAEAADHPPADR